MFGRETLKEFMRGEQEKTLRVMEENREFGREILLRNEKVIARMMLQLEENTKQTRANTEAVLKLLDRFDEPGGSTA